MLFLTHIAIQIQVLFSFDSMALVFVGAGGSGVSALVQLMIDLHIPDLMCIDSTHSAAMDKFQAAGVCTIIWHGNYLPKKDDFLIYSAATKESPEVVAAFALAHEDRLSSPPLLYAEFLWEISKYLYTVAISGTHGKSTTTGMVATACIAHIPQTALAIVWAWVTARQGNHCRHNPTHDSELRLVILRIISRKATTIHVEQKKRVFVIEADEFNHHFLCLEPDLSIITSLDHDHIEIYPTRESYLDAFNQFVHNTKDCVITLESIAKQLTPSDKIRLPSQEQFSFEHLVWGHNHTNASLALAAVDYLNPEKNITNHSTHKHTITSFQWLSRRVEYLGNNTHHVPVFSDYGHHPDEILSTIKAFKETYPNTHLTCFFEPHQARRLLSFWQEFLTAWHGVSKCIIVPLFASRETLEEIRQYRQTLSWSFLPYEIDSFEDITLSFCTQLDATYLPDRSMLRETINSIQSWSILCFTAGVLDSKLRACIKK